MTARQNSVPSWVGRRITRERERRGWSLRDLSRKAGVSASTSLRVEAGHDTALSSVLAIAEAFGMPVGTLLAEPSCQVCDGEAPAGFMCKTCGRPEASR